MFPPNTWCFDLEIRNAIPDYKKGFTTYYMPGISYCKHWGDHAGMGVSVLVAARPDMSEIRVYTSDRHDGCYPLVAFDHLIREADLLVSHHGRFFDAKVLAARGIFVPDWKHLDTYFEIKKAVKQQAPKGYNLEALSQRCGGPGKTGDGAMMPMLWQRGQRELVINYCKNDIKMTCAIASYYATHGARIPSNTPDHPLLSHVQLRTPQEVMTYG